MLSMLLRFHHLVFFPPLLPTGMSTKFFLMVKGEQREDKENATKPDDQLLLILLLLLLNAMSSEFALRLLHPELIYEQRIYFTQSIAHSQTFQIPCKSQAPIRNWRQYSRCEN